MRLSRILPCLVLLSSLAVISCTVKSTRLSPTVRVVQEYAPLVVNIRTERLVNLREHPDWGKYGEQLDRFFQQYFGENYSAGTLTLKSVGSGVLVGRKGLIITNAHVVHRARTIYVVLNDGAVLEGNPVKINTGDDLALIKVALPSPVKDIKFADMSGLLIGETVIAIGNPFGLENSVTAGVISGINRSFSSPQCEYVCSGLLQTDASINPGNSGGALFNLDGELIGINLAVVAGAQNIGFAVPVNKVLYMLENIK